MARSNDNIKDNNVWGSLVPVTTFDTGRSFEEEPNRRKNDILIKLKSSESPFLLPSLLMICKLTESEPKVQDKLYKLLCKANEQLMQSLPGHKLELNLTGIHQKKYFEDFQKLVKTLRATLHRDIPRSLDAFQLYHYSEHFEEIEFIAAGGFGSVYKAIYRLDNTQYAIKKIRIRRDKIDSIVEHLEEVKTLAKLEHCNIVPYKTAWIEPLQRESSVVISDESSKRKPAELHSLPPTKNKSRVHNIYLTPNKSVILFRENEQLEDIENYTSELKHQSLENSNSSDSIVFTKNSQSSHSTESSKEDNNLEETKSKSNESSDQTSESSHSSDFVISFSDDVSIQVKKEREKITNCTKMTFTEDSSSSNVSTEENREMSKFFSNQFRLKVSKDETNPTDSNENKTKSSVTGYSEITQTSSENNTWGYLYIQMALCDTTLRQWMNNREPLTTDFTYVTIISQILAGLNYIHSLNIVHHDIKPSNIFISQHNGEIKVKIGDFGLACTLQKDSHDAIGTHVYAAPEQLKGYCNPKSDIYSLGVVCVELLVSMSTLMERMKVLNDLKKNKDSKVLDHVDPQYRAVILKLLQDNPAKRPSSLDLVKELNLNKDALIAKLNRQNQILNDENKQVKAEYDQIKAKYTEMEAKCKQIEAELETLRKLKK